MAFVPLAQTTLKTFRSVVRRKSGVNDPQATVIPMTDPIINDLIHDAITRVRHAANKLVDAEYRTKSTVGSPVVAAPISIFDISTLEIYDVNRVTIASTIKDLAVISGGQYDTLIKLRSNDSLKDAAFAKIENDPSNAALDVIVYIGSNLTAPTTIDVTYPRNPKKQTVDSGKVDIPERLIPAAISVAAVAVRAVANNEPKDIAEDTIIRTLQSELAQFGITITPTRN